jgi:hypothetical protein
MAVLLLAGALAGCDLGDAEQAQPTTSEARVEAPGTSTEKRVVLGPLTPNVARRAVLLHLRDEGSEKPELLQCLADTPGRVTCQFNYGSSCDTVVNVTEDDGMVNVRETNLAVCVGRID